MDLKLIR